MPISFPSSPTSNQTYTYGGRTYRWTGTAWEFVSGGGGSGLAWSSVPASATATGTAGQIAYDGDYIYVAPQQNTWVRAALSTWTPFTPASVSGLQAWYDASDASTLYDATSGGSLVAADGAVARWEDKSGNARHLTQATSGSRPQRKASQQGGKDTLFFNESALLSVPNSTTAFKFLHSTDSSVFFVTRPGTTSDPQKLLALLSTSTGGSGGQPAFSIFYEDRVLPSDNYTANDACNVLIGRASPTDLSTGNAVVDVGGTTTPVGLTNWTANQYSVISCVLRPTNSTAANRLSQRKNGGAAVTGNTGTATPGTGDAPNNLTVGSLAGSVSFLWLGNIAELIIYNAALSDTDRAAVESYLMSKWGIS